MSTIETISLTVPPEPADKSVVLGKDGTAWQRHGDGWKPTTYTPASVDWDTWAGWSWPHLLVDHKPLTVIYYATEDEL